MDIVSFKWNWRIFSAVVVVELILGGKLFDSGFFFWLLILDFFFVRILFVQYKSNNICWISSDINSGYKKKIWLKIDRSIDENCKNRLKIETGKNMKINFFLLDTFYNKIWKFLSWKITNNNNIVWCVFNLQLK